MSSRGIIASCFWGAEKISFLCPQHFFCWLFLSSLWAGAFILWYEKCLNKSHSGSCLLCQFRSPWTCFFSQSFQFVLQILSEIMGTIPLQAGQEAFWEELHLWTALYKKLLPCSCFFFYFSQRLQQSFSCSSNDCGLVQLVLLFPYQQMK